MYRSNRHSWPTPDLIGFVTDLQYCEALECVLALTGPSSKTLEVLLDVIHFLPHFLSTLMDYFAYVWLGQMFRLRNSAEVKKKVRRRQKREKDRRQKDAADVSSPADPGDMPLNGADSATPVLGDLLEECASCKSSHKLKSIAVRYVDHMYSTYI